MDKRWDKKLKIHTEGRDDSHEDAHHYPYEPTPYSVLERLAESGYITEESCLIDYGCGKGRAGFFLNHETGCDVIGVEYEESIYRQAQANLDSYGRNRGVQFVCENAEAFEVKDADCFYFFNPFSVEILQSVLHKVTESYYENPREMRLFFYYPNDKYLSVLMRADEWMFLDEIDCQDLFSTDNERERILVFEIMD